MNSAETFSVSTNTLAAHYPYIYAKSNYGIWGQLMHENLISLQNFGNHLEHWKPKSSLDEAFEHHYLIIIRLRGGLATDKSNSIFVPNISKLLHNINILKFDSRFPKLKIAQFCWLEVIVFFFGFRCIFLHNVFLFSNLNLGCSPHSFRFWHRV